MRAISPIAAYGIQLVEARTKRGMDSTGTIVEYTDGESVHAQFSRGGLTDWEQLEAFEHFDFSGLPEGVNPITRVSVFDSEAYVQKYSDPVERELRLKEIDERLVHFSKMFPSEFRIVEKPASPKPWPTYDETPLEDVIVEGRVETPGMYTMQALTGISPEAIRLYEVENQNRPEVVEAMEALEADAAAKEGQYDPSISVSV